MRGYVLTGRGKIIVIAVPAILLIALVSLIIALQSAAAGRPPQDEPADPSASVSPDAKDLTTPVWDTPPTQSDPPDDTPDSPEQTPGQADSNTESSAAPGTAQSTDKPPQSSAAPEDDAEETPAPIDDTLSFSFNPEEQTVLDSDTTSKLDVFLKIPDYLPDYLIIIETPRLSEHDGEAVMQAVTGAMLSRGVLREQLEHIRRPEAPPNGSFMVTLYFAPVLKK